MGMDKNCSTCGVPKPLDEFDLNRNSKDGRTGVCKKCRQANYRKRYQSNKNGIRDKHHAYRRLVINQDLARRADDKAGSLKRSQKSRARQKMLPNYEEIKESKNRHRVLHRHGVSKKQYGEMEAAQGGNCMICGGVNKSGRRLAVDHCHATGKLRDLLCSNCNCGLGNFRDKPELLIAAAHYLCRHATVKDVA